MCILDLSSQLIYKKRKNNIDDGKALKTKKQTEKRKKSLFSAMMLDVRLLAHCPLQTKNEQIQKTVVMT